MNNFAVDCIFLEDGSVRVQRVRLNNNWIAVEQGRQWQDEEGRHVLVMVSGTDVYEIVLSGKTLTWESKRVQGPGATAV